MAYEPITITPEQLAALDSEHDDVQVFKGSAKAPWIAVLRRPTFDESIAYKAMAAKPEQKPLSAVKLIERICVYPKGPDWKRQFDRWPFFPDAVSINPAFEDFIGASLTAAEK